MKADILILRPEPGASRTQERASTTGLRAVKAPLFHIKPIAWAAPPAGRYDALILTSANAARHAGPGLANYASIRCYAVGESSAAAARDAGMEGVATGPSDAAALLDMALREGIRSALHLCGRDHLPIEHPEIGVESRPVYAADAVAALPPAAVEALAEGAVALLHSPRAGRLFGSLVGEAGLDRSRIAVAAISEAALAAAGTGWRSAAAASAPRDPALLALAQKLCQTDREDGPGRKA